MEGQKNVSEELLPLALRRPQLRRGGRLLRTRGHLSHAERPIALLRQARALAERAEATEGE